MAFLTSLLLTIVVGGALLLILGYFLRGPVISVLVAVAKAAGIDLGVENVGLTGVKNLSAVFEKGPVQSIEVGEIALSGSLLQAVLGSADGWRLSVSLRGLQVALRPPKLLEAEAAAASSKASRQPRKSGSSISVFSWGLMSSICRQLEVRLEDVSVHAPEFPDLAAALDELRFTFPAPPASEGATPIRVRLRSKPLRVSWLPASGDHEAIEKGGGQLGQTLDFVDVGASELVVDLAVSSTAQSKSDFRCTQVGLRCGNLALSVGHRLTSCYADFERRRVHKPPVVEDLSLGPKPPGGWLAKAPSSMAMQFHSVAIIVAHDKLDDDFQLAARTIDVRAAPRPATSLPDSGAAGEDQFGYAIACQGVTLGDRRSEPYAETDSLTVDVAVPAYAKLMTWWQHSSIDLFLDVGFAPVEFDYVPHAADWVMALTDHASDILGHRKANRKLRKVRLAAVGATQRRPDIEKALKWQFCFHAPSLKTPRAATVGKVKPLSNGGAVDAHAGREAAAEGTSIAGNERRQTLAAAMYLPKVDLSMTETLITISTVRFECQSVVLDDVSGCSSPAPPRVAEVERVRVERDPLPPDIAPLDPRSANTFEATGLTLWLSPERLVELLGFVDFFLLFAKCAKLLLDRLEEQAVASHPLYQEADAKYVSESDGRRTTSYGVDVRSARVVYVARVPVGLGHGGYSTLDDAYACGSGGGTGRGTEGVLDVRLSHMHLLSVLKDDYLTVDLEGLNVSYEEGVGTAEKLLEDVAAAATGAAPSGGLRGPDGRREDRGSGQGGISAGASAEGEEANWRPPDAAGRPPTELASVATLRVVRRRRRAVLSDLVHPHVAVSAFGADLCWDSDVHLFLFQLLQQRRAGMRVYEARQVAPRWLERQPPAVRTPLGRTQLAVKVDALKARAILSLRGNEYARVTATIDSLRSSDLKCGVSVSPLAVDVDGEVMVTADEFTFQMKPMPPPVDLSSGVVVASRGPTQPASPLGDEAADEATPAAPIGGKGYVIAASNMHIAEVQGMFVYAIAMAAVEIRKLVKIGLAALAELYAHGQLADVDKARVSPRYVDIGSIEIRLDKGVELILEDDPLEAWLDVHHRILGGILKEAHLRETFFGPNRTQNRGAPAAASSPNAGSVLPTSTATSTVHPLSDLCLKLYIEKCKEQRASQGKRAHVMRAYATGFELSLIPFAGGVDDVVATVHCIDPYAENVTLDELYGGTAYIGMRDFAISFRSIPRPLVALKSMYISGPLFFSQQAIFQGPPTRMQVLLGRRRSVTTFKNSASAPSAPWKVYMDLSAEGDALHTCLATYYEPTLVDVVNCMKRLTSSTGYVPKTPLVPPPDGETGEDPLTGAALAASAGVEAAAVGGSSSSGSLMWWDNMRYMFQGRFTCDATNWRFVMPVGFDFTKALDELWWEAPSMRFTMAGIHSVSFHYRNLVLTPRIAPSMDSVSGQRLPDLPILKSPETVLSGTFNWARADGDDPRAHFLHPPQQCADAAWLAATTSDLLEPFKSSSLRLSVSLTMRPAGAEGSEGRVARGVSISDSLELPSTMLALSSSPVKEPIFFLGPDQIVWVRRLYWAIMYPPDYIRNGWARRKFGAPRAERVPGQPRPPSLNQLLNKMDFEFDFTKLRLLHVASEPDDPAEGLVLSASTLQAGMKYERPAAKEGTKPSAEEASAVSEAAVSSPPPPGDGAPADAAAIAISPRPRTPSLEMTTIVFITSDLQAMLGADDSGLDSMTGVKRRERRRLNRQLQLLLELEMTPTLKSEAAQGSDDFFFHAASVRFSKRSAVDIDRGEEAYVGSVLDRGSDTLPTTNSFVRKRESTASKLLESQYGADCWLIVLYRLKLLWTTRARDASRAWFSSMADAAYQPLRPRVAPSKDDKRPAAAAAAAAVAEAADGAAGGAEAEPRGDVLAAGDSPAKRAEPGGGASTMSLSPALSGTPLESELPQSRGGRESMESVPDVFEGNGTDLFTMLLEGKLKRRSMEGRHSLESTEGSQAGGSRGESGGAMVVQDTRGHVRMPSDALPPAERKGLHFDEGGFPMMVVDVQQPQFNMEGGAGDGRLLVVAQNARFIMRYNPPPDEPGRYGTGIGSWSDNGDKRERTIYALRLNRAESHMFNVDIDPSTGAQWMVWRQTAAGEEELVASAARLFTQIIAPCDFNFQFIRYYRQAQTEPPDLPLLPSGGSGGLEASRPDAGAPPGGGHARENSGSSGQTVIMSKSSLREVSFHTPSVVARMDSRHWQTVYAIISNLFLGAMPKWEWGGGDNLVGVDGILWQPLHGGDTAAVARARALLRQRRRLFQRGLDSLHLLSGIEAEGDLSSLSRNQSAGNDAGAPDEKADLWWLRHAGCALLHQQLQLDVFSMMEEMVAARAALWQAIKDAEEMRSDDKRKVPSALRINCRVGEMSWSLEQGDVQFVNASIDEMSLMLVRGEDDSATVRFVVHHVRLLNLMPSAVNPELLVPWDKTRDWSREVMVRVFSSQESPSEGAVQVSHFEVAVFPLRINMTEDVGTGIWNYFAPRLSDKDRDKEKEKEKAAVLPQSRGLSFRRNKDRDKGDKDSGEESFRRGGTLADRGRNKSMDLGEHEEFRTSGHSRQGSNSSDTGSAAASHSRYGTWSLPASEAGAEGGDRLQLAVVPGRGGSSTAWQASRAADDVSESGDKDGGGREQGLSKKERKKRASRRETIYSFSYVRINEFQASVSYAGRPVSFHDLWLRVSPLVYSDFRGSWWDLTTSFKKHVLWSVVKSIAHLQGKRSKDAPGDGSSRPSRPVSPGRLGSLMRGTRLDGPGEASTSGAGGSGTGGEQRGVIKSLRRGMGSRTALDSELDEAPTHQASLPTSFSSSALEAEGNKLSARGRLKSIAGKGKKLLGRKKGEGAERADDD